MNRSPDETQERERDREPVNPTFSFVEAILGIAAIRDYTRRRRQDGLGEDAVVAYFYDELLEATRNAAEEDPEGFDLATKVAQIPDTLGREIRGEPYR